MHNILQWNCNGCLTHFNELKMLITEYLPFSICLQETHFKPAESFTLRGYNIFRKDVEPNLRARGGVAIFIQNHLPTRNVPIQSNLQVVAVEIDYPIKMTIANIYLPNFDWSVEDLKNITAQLQTPYLILGDFNAHNPLWGSDNLDRRGRLIEQFLDDENLILLNTGEGTYLNSRSNNFSSIDLTICSST